MITITHLDDVDEARELHTLAFPTDTWVGDDHTFWVAREGEEILGFCSAIQWPHRSAVFLSRAAVVARAQGRGLHRRMICHRVSWAWDEVGVNRVVTYTTLQNYPSMSNLIALGFRFYRPETPWVGKRVHYFQLKR